MDLNATIDIIIKDLHEVRDIIDDLKKYPGVPVLQIELARSKCKSAAEVIALLKEFHESLNSVKVEKQYKAEEKTEVKEASSGKKAEKQDFKESWTEKRETVMEEKAIPVVVASLPVEDRHETSQVYLKEIAPEIIREKPAARKQPENAIIADQFNDRAESFNEKLGGLKHDDDVSEILKTKPLSNLQEAIGINDRFLFIREVFNGNIESYNEAILKLNSAGNLDEAKALVAGFTRENTDTDIVRQLMDLVKRKFHPNE